MSFKESIHKEREKLRFAPIIRVSTEAQEQRGESLDLQKRLIESAVKYHGGIIPKHCWQYCGQEHATPNQERKLFNKMLTHCEDDLFDAVIFAEFSRWARDQEVHARAIKILQKNGKKLYMGHQRFDLNTPADKRMLGYGVVDAESTAGTMLKSSIEGKINIAKRGFPINGRVPFGRRLVNPQDKSGKSKKKAIYEVIPDDQKFAQKIADRYIKGESLEKLHKQQNRIGGFSTFRRILTKQSGPKWQRSFECKDFGIKEKFETDIEELLDKETRDKIDWRIERNSGPDHPYRKYLLSSLIFCGYCGKKFHGKMVNGKVHYRHNKPPCGNIYSIKADKLEMTVQASVFNVAYDSKAADEAIRRAIPDSKERKKLEADLKREQRKFSKLKTEKSNIVRAIRKGSISDDDAGEDMKDIKEEMLEKKNIINQIEYKLKEMPDPDDKMTKRQMGLLKQIIRSAHRSPSRMLKMDFEKRREILKRVFDGKEYGIYLFKVDGLPRTYHYKLKWIFEIEEAGRVPMPGDWIMELLGLDKNEYADLISPCKLVSASP